jgi:hypothetical protein
MTNLARGWIARHALSVEDYHRMGEAGILHEEDRVELIEGEIIDMGPIGSLHAGTVAELMIGSARRDDKRDECNDSGAHSPAADQCG